jgi:hypothetical protein
MVADAVPYAGHTIEGRRIVLDVRGRVVVHVRAGLRHLRCETFGDIGPLVVSEAAHAPIGRDGRVDFTVGERAQRVTVHGLLRGRTIRGTLRVRGSIATGQPCATRALRYAATRPAPSSGASSAAGTGRDSA